MSDAKVQKRIPLYQRIGTPAWAWSYCPYQRIAAHAFAPSTPQAFIFLIKQAHSTY